MESVVLTEKHIAFAHMYNNEKYRTISNLVVCRAI